MPFKARFGQSMVWWRQIQPGDAVWDAGLPLWTRHWWSTSSSSQGIEACFFWIPAYTEDGMRRPVSWNWATTRLLNYPLTASLFELHPGSFYNQRDEGGQKAQREHGTFVTPHTSVPFCICSSGWLFSSFQPLRGHQERQRTERLLRASGRAPGTIANPRSDFQKLL